MVWHRFEIKNTWQAPPSHKVDADGAQGEYDFHAFCLEIMDVVWAWCFAACVVALLLLVL